MVWELVMSKRQKAQKTSSTRNDITRHIFSSAVLWILFCHGSSWTVLWIHKLSVILDLFTAVLQYVSAPTRLHFHLRQPRDNLLVLTLYWQTPGKRSLCSLLFE